MKTLNIRNLQRVSAGDLKEPFEVVSRGRKLGTWYPGEEKLVGALIVVTKRLEEVAGSIDNPYKREGDTMYIDDRGDNKKKAGIILCHDEDLETAKKLIDNDNGIA